MRFARLNELEENMIVALPVINKLNQVLLLSGATLTRYTINKLKIIMR